MNKRLDDFAIITADQMFVQIFKILPSFQKVWDRFVNEWKEEPLPYYLLFPDLIRLIDELFEKEDIQTLNRVFKVVESWHLRGDEYVREASIVGFLEDLQNENLVDNPFKFFYHLTPESKYWWNKLNATWSGGGKLED